MCSVTDCKNQGGFSLLSATECAAHASERLGFLKGKDGLKFNHALAAELGVPSFSRFHPGVQEWEHRTGRTNLASYFSDDELAVAMAAVRSRPLPDCQINLRVVSDRIHGGRASRRCNRYVVQCLACRIESFMRHDTVEAARAEFDLHCTSGRFLAGTHAIAA